MKKIVIATKNQGKLREMKAAFAHLPVEIVSLASFGDLPDAVEDGATFEANARIKAHFFREATQTACIADDSGIELDALDGAPGVHSARFAGHHGDDAANNAKMIAELQARGRTSSPADYRCALVFEDTDGTVLTADGRVNGTIRFDPRGTGGFGYDPYFYVAHPDGSEKTMAELTLAEKDAISHRGKALRELVSQLENYFDCRK
ncbi:RdgB/HAM1 family non-canonical purine NTP pyrophosphatase [Selenomonas sp.]|uniref:RdgB/HAM1 family non-canonical purine NTP pyrophosphatase n=1 Tax=Selenomonas sp. TaxID=2053611 RepID=UPI0025FA1DB0|nr:RdgB/HAM1 family non-canonical purine NTP pyrophosphatase [Selenomonas sp.]MCI6284484.1 RdgB/HAM1 family non-canonical purine NTP pyrophosphatase [Selenomonas sp.]